MSRAVIDELRLLIGRIRALRLPDCYSADDKARDAVSRAGVCTEIKRRIAELEGTPPAGPANDFEQLAATTVAVAKEPTP